MKPPKLTPEQIRELGSPIYGRQIPGHWADTNGHVNVRWYAVLFDDAGDVLHDLHGLTVESHRLRNSGTMDMEHHTWFVSETMPGESVTVYVRALQVNPKRFHYLMFLVNKTQNRLAAIFECINAFVDLKVRKTAPWPEASQRLIEEMIAAHANASWEAPISGAMSV